MLNSQTARQAGPEVDPLWLGAGRFPTLTTEAVALSSGGSNGIFAAQALWQLLLPLIIFALTALVAKWVGYVRQGLR